MTVLHLSSPRYTYLTKLLVPVWEIKVLVCWYGKCNA